MKRKSKVKQETDRPIGDLRVIADFLPSPEKLLPKEDTIKVTVALDQDTVTFFKTTAQKMGLKYQRMIREVLKGYAKKYS